MFQAWLEKKQVESESEYEKLAQNFNEASEMINQLKIEEQKLKSTENRTNVTNQEKITNLER